MEGRGEREEHNRKSGWGKDRSRGRRWKGAERGKETDKSRGGGGEGGQTDIDRRQTTRENSS